jgi:hypothetical protein
MSAALALRMLARSSHRASAAASSAEVFFSGAAKARRLAAARALLPIAAMISVTLSAPDARILVMLILV